MPSVSRPDITGLLVAWKGGDAAALDRLVSLLYPEIRRVARQHLARRRGDSIESAALANEAYLKLANAGVIPCEGRAHFLALCSQIMRRLLVDHVRRRGYAKRGGNALTVSIEGVEPRVEARDVDLLALDAALDSLGAVDPRKLRVVELRYFGGLSVEETGDVLGVSTDTVKRDWRVARAWLRRQLQVGRSRPPTRAQSR